MPDNDNINNEELVLDVNKPQADNDFDAEFERREAALAAALAAQGREEAAPEEPAPAPLAPSEEGAVEDGKPSETEGEITPPAPAEHFTPQSGASLAEGEHNVA
ncbi:MAG: hypothetical protein J5756_01780, partial [Clostridia bacterium]|nr:hypothetical protein [Clostridia bacterium]